MADRGRLVGILQKYLPTGTEDYAADLLLKHSIHLYIKKPRTSKFGDYRAPRPGENHRISVNKDLNPYAFLVTFLHEVAHLLNYEKHRTRVKPHGPEWKLHFRYVSLPVFEQKVLPHDVESALVHYLSNPRASSCSSPLLFRTLRRYDEAQEWCLVEEIPANTVFVTKDGRAFLKGERMRTRYRCMERGTGRVYLVPGLMQCRPQLA